MLYCITELAEVYSALEEQELLCQKCQMFCLFISGPTEEIQENPKFP